MCVCYLHKTTHLIKLLSGLNKNVNENEIHSTFPSGVNLVV